MAKAKNGRMPADLGACLRELARVKRQLDAIEAKKAPLDAAEAALREHLLQSFKKSELQGARGSGISLSVVKTQVPNISDWAAFVKYATRKGNDDLLQKKVSSAAWRERIEAGRAVPGVTAYDATSLRVNRA